MTTPGQYFSLIASQATQSSWVGARNPNLFTPLILLLLTLPYLPFIQRKHLLTSCRIQQSHRINKYLQASFQECVSQHPYILLPLDLVILLHTNGIVVSSTNLEVAAELILDLFSSLYHSPALCGVLSYFTRASETVFPDQFLQAGLEGISKEILASQVPNVAQQLDYAALFSDSIRPVHRELVMLPYKTHGLWVKHIERMKERFSSKDCILLPHYNSRKNMSYSTQSAYNVAVHGYDSQERNVTSLDLLKLYHHTGHQVLGNLELRTSFRFNDLKPRLYYCLGGDAYWASNFIKTFTTTLMESFPSTHSFSRFEVQRIDRIERDQILVTYDYSSFTTSLSELKYFVYELANAFSEVYVNVLDVHLGIVEIELADYLRQYNEIVNIHGAFETSRLFKENQTFVSFQGRGGSLGVGGNIGLSGLCHGYSLAGFDDEPHKHSVVGDDALLSILKSNLQLLMLTTNKLGHINPDKFTTIERDEINPMGSSINSFKYLKRPLEVFPDGTFRLGILDDFPNVMQMINPDGDGIHTPSRLAETDLIKSFIMQVGRYFTTQVSRMTDESGLETSFDAYFVLECFGIVYDKYGIPREGSCPRLSFEQDAVGNFERVRSQVWCPPVDDISVYHVDWLTVLQDRQGSYDVLVPHMVKGEIPLPLYPTPGITEVTTRNGKFTKLISNLGYCKLDMVIESKLFTREVVSQMRLIFASNLHLEGIYPMYNVLFYSIPHFYLSYLESFEDPDYLIEYEPEMLRLELESIGIESD